MVKVIPGLSTHSLQGVRGPRREILKCCFASLAKPSSKPPVSVATDVKVCSKRQVLLGGASLLLAPLMGHQASAKPSSADTATATFKGFDGLGGSHADYANAQLREIAVGNGGGVASVHVDGFEQLMPIFIGVAEAAALVYATSSEEGRRPSTLGTWRRSLEATGSKVERVVITRLENHTYFSRIVLSLPGGAKCSVDARPSDSLALGLQCEAPLFVARHLAEEQQDPTLDAIIDELGKLNSSELEELERQLEDELEEQELDPESSIIPQEASTGRSWGLQATQAPAKPLVVTAAGMQDMEDFHLKVCTVV